MLIIGQESLFNSGNTPAMLKYLTPAKTMSPTLATIFLPAAGKKIKKAEFVKEAESIIEYCEVHNIKAIAVTQADYYKNMTGRNTFEGDVGVVKKGTGTFEGYSIIPIVNYNITTKYPQKAKIFEKGIRALAAFVKGEYQEESYRTPKISKIFTDPKEAYQEFKKVIKAPVIACDIETTGLSWFEDDMLTISFASGEDHTFCCALHPKYSNKARANSMKEVVQKFLEAFEGRLVFHNAAFDIPFVIHQLFRLGDFSKPHIPIVNNLNLDDTLLMAYVTYNSTERPSLRLKDLVRARYGEYDEHIDQRFLFQADLKDVGTYNNLDVAATYYLYERFMGNEEKGIEGELITQDTYKTYTGLYRNLNKFVIKMKMEGLRVDEELLKTYATQLNKMLEKDKKTLLNKSAVQRARQRLIEEAVDKKNKTLVTKQVDESYFEDFEFNPNSSVHKRVLFFEVLGLPVINTTDTGAPSVDKDTLAEFASMSLDKDTQEIISLLEEIALAEKVVSTYLTGFRDFNTEVKKGDHRIFGNFLLHGTVSGRLSSRNPNLQNLPSGSKYGKMVKRCFVAPEGFLFAGIDYSALEDRLIAIESGSPAKLRVFTEGIDGHCLNASAYFKEELENRGIIIDANSAESVNSLAKLAPDLRQAGKSVTFGMSYGAFPKKVAEQLKVSLAAAQVIFNNYWELYRDIKKYNTKKIEEAREKGYTVSVFSGLRLLTPQLTSRDGGIVSKEERVIGNFAIQSGNILTLIRVMEFQEWLENEGLTEDVKVFNSIHDAVYLYIKQDAELVARVNKKLVEVLTKDYTENQPIHLEAELDIGINWKKQVTLKNSATPKEISGIMAALVNA
jgi:DNA polymerase-1